MSKRWSDSIDEDQLEAMTVKERTRQDVISEILSTEAQFVEDLQNVIEVYYQPLVSSQILDNASLDAIFCNILSVYEAHKKFNQALLSRKADDGLVIRHFCDIFVDHISIFEHYHIYCSNQLNGSNMLMKCCLENRAFLDFLQTKKVAHPRLNHLDLSSFLLKPMQRITKYPLFLKSLLQTMDSQHEDYDATKNALALVESEVCRVNDAVHRHESRRKVKDIENILDCSELESPIVINDQREYCHEGMLLSPKPNQQEYHALLFSDVLILCKKRKEREQRLTAQLLIYLHGVAVTDLADSEHQLHALQLSMTDDTSRSALFLCPSQRDKLQWMHFLEKYASSSANTNASSLVSSHARLHSQPPHGSTATLVGCALKKRKSFMRHTDDKNKIQHTLFRNNSYKAPSSSVPLLARTTEPGKTPDLERGDGGLIQRSTDLLQGEPAETEDLTDSDATSPGGFEKFVKKRLSFRRHKKRMPSAIGFIDRTVVPVEKQLVDLPVPEDSAKRDTASAVSSQRSSLNVDPMMLVLMEEIEKLRADLELTKRGLEETRALCLRLQEDAQRRATVDEQLELQRRALESLDVDRKRDTVAALRRGNSFRASNPFAAESAPRMPGQPSVGGNALPPTRIPSLNRLRATETASTTTNPMATPVEERRRRLASLSRKVMNAGVTPAKQQQQRVPSIGSGKKTVGSKGTMSATSPGAPPTQEKENQPL